MCITSCVERQLAADLQRRLGAVFAHQQRRQPIQRQSMRRRELGLVAVGAPPRVGELTSPTILLLPVAVVGHGRRREARRRLLHRSRAAEAQGRHEVVGRIGSGVGGGLGTGVLRAEDEVVGAREGAGDEALPRAAHGCLCARCMIGAADGRTRHDAQRRGTRQRVCQAPICRCALCLVCSRPPVSRGVA